MATKSKAKTIKSSQAPKATPAQSMKDKAVDAALDMASRMSWDMVTMTDIADKAHVSLAELSDVFDDKTDILVAYGKRLDKKVLVTCAHVDPSTPERDRLFEILMERFDLLNDDRAAVVSILKSFAPDPKQAVISLPHLGRSMTWMLEAAGIESNGIKGAIRVAGLMAVYLESLRHWMNDDGDDLPKTMAALDRNLNRAQKCANTFML